MTADNVYLGRLPSGLEVWSISPPEHIRAWRQYQRQAAERHRADRDAEERPDDYGLNGQVPHADDDPGPTEPPEDDQRGDDQDQPEADDNEGAIAHRLKVLRINHEARRRLDEENRPSLVLPPAKSLDILLAEPNTPVHYRIDKLAPADGRCMLSAQFKAGKTTIVANLLRSLADGDPFLGHFTVTSPAHRVVLIDDEMSQNTLRGWLRDQQITNTAAVADVVALRGRIGAFNLLDEHCRDMWTARLRDMGCDYLILDCLRPVLDALGLDENRDTGQFLAAYDTMLADAGISDSLLLQHMGHTHERARGDSRLLDWPDALWRLFRADPEDPSSARYFSAYGRDVDVHEGRLGFDPATRRLTYAPGSRNDAEVEAALRTVIEVIAQDAKAGGNGLSGRGIEDAIGEDHTQKTVRLARARAIKERLVVVEQGPRRAKIHSIANPCEQCGLPVAAGRTRHESCLEWSEGLFDS